MPKLLSRRSTLLIIVTGITLTVAACGGGDTGGPTPTAASFPAETATTAAETTDNATSPPSVAGNASVGAEVFVSQGCSACHSTGENRVVGPGLKGVGERAAVLGGVDYLVESIKDPTAVVVEGFNAVMPRFNNLDDQTIADLVAYLNSLN